MINNSDPESESILNHELFDSLLGSLFDVVPEGVLVVDKESTIIYINDRMQEMWNTPKNASSHEARSRAAELVLDQAWFNKRNQEINNSELNVFDEIVELKDSRIFKRSSKPLIVKGKKEGRIWTYQNVSQEYHSRKLLENLIDHAPIGIALAGENRQFLSVNRALSESLGYTQDELLGTTFKDHTHTDDLADSVQILSKMDSGETNRFHFEKRYVHKDGSIINAFIHVARLPKYGNQDVQYIAQIVDLTQLKKAEEALFQSQKLESIGVLAGGIAHDFNNLLVAMNTQADVALRKSSLNQNPTQNIEKIKLAAKNASYLAEQLLAYSGKRKFKVEEIDLNLQIEKSTGIFNLAIPKNISFRKDLRSDLPLVSAEKSQIQQILLNLIMNATEALEGQSGEINIETDQVTFTAEHILNDEDFLLSPIEEGKHVLITVRDSGIGMDDQTIKKIFDPFFTTKYTGRGLGLAAVLGIIRGHRGAIKVTSQVGIGTTFEIYFPALPDNESISSQGSNQLIANDVIRNDVENELSVLLIDDDENVRDALIDLFEFENIKLICAADGTEGITKLVDNKNDIALTLLDLSMPGLSSPETFSELKKINPELPIMLCSGFSEKKISDSFKSEEVAGFISKPFNSDELINLVQTYTRTDKTQSAD